MNIIEILFGGGVIFALLNIIMQNKEIYINNINSKRSDSNNELRKEISKIVAFCILYKRLNATNYNQKDIINNIEYEFYQAIAMARMHLSIHPERMGNVGHDLLDIKLKEIQDKDRIKQKTADEILFLTRKILDSEWNRVKNEAKGEI